MLRFLTDELQDAEDAGDRGTMFSNLLVLAVAHISFSVWILGHVLPGWDGTNAMEDPTNICTLRPSFEKVRYAN